MADKEIVRTERAPAPFEGAPYNQAVKAAASSSSPASSAWPRTGAGGRAGRSPSRPSRRCRICSAILEEAGSGLDQLAKTTVFLQNLDDFAAMNEVYATHVGDRPPARSTVEVAKLPSGALVEIEAIASL